MKAKSKFCHLGYLELNLCVFFPKPFPTISDECGRFHLKHFYFRNKNVINLFYTSGNFTDTFRQKRLPSSVQI